MASKVVCLSQDQNLNVPSDGVSVAGKPALKSTKKGGLGGRKPLADLSNRGKPDFTKVTKKPALNNFPKIIADASKKKGSSETLLQKTSNVVSEEFSCEYEKEGFLHDHEQCMKTMREATQLDAMDINWMINGPTPCKKLASPPKPSELTKFEQESLIMYLKEIPEDQYILLPTTKYSVSSPPLSPPPSPDWYTNLRIGVNCDIQHGGAKLTFVGFLCPSPPSMPKQETPICRKTIHAQIIKSGLHLGVFLMNNLINYYIKTGSYVDAHHVFDEMPLRNRFSWNTILSSYTKQGRLDVACRVFNAMPERDSVSWTAMIVGFNQMGRYGDAINMFLEMVSDGVPVTQFTVTNILSACASVKGLDIGRKVHSFVVKLAVGSYVSVGNCLVNMYAKCGDPGTAKIVFERMRLKNVSSWNHMISIHMQCGRADLALAQFNQMTEHDIVSWNSMIAGYNQHGLHTEAVSIFSSMRKDSFLKPDKFTLASILSACASLEKLELGKQIHALIVRAGLDTSEAVVNALISMYAKSGGLEIAENVLEQCGTSDLNLIAFTALLDGYIKVGDVNPARQIFDSLRNCDVVAWTAMIVGYMQNGLNNDALELFRSMIAEGPWPNNYTLAAMLSVSSSLASLDYGKQIHATAIRTGQVSSVSVGNALITMYSKAGSISGAKQVFNLIDWNRDTVSWSSMILALAQHGLGEESIELFEKMLSLGIRPDHITYVGVLSACTHVGLVEQGRSYYNLMRSVHKIEPTHSHYACMVDLLGRAGLLQEAYDVIQNMPIEPDVIAWGSLLSACKLHKNVDLAKVAAEKLLLIEPDNSGAYSALANLYSACGRWADAAEVRKLMKNRKVKKGQGFSWIEYQNKVHVFGVDDWVHPQRDGIYKTMEKIWEEIKNIGFVPDTESVLHDVAEELKEKMLMHHSEKLAIAFGLINTPDNSTLRIMKNLRVCNDCHTAIKFITKLVGREIILRDTTRFHHFKNGTCSCRDYW